MSVDYRRAHHLTEPTGWSYASNCNQEWSTYSSIVDTPPSSSQVVAKSSTSLAVYSAPLTTFCGGTQTQIVGPLDLEYYSTIWSTATVWTSSDSVTLPSPPSCTLNANDCASLERTYSEAGHWVPCTDDITASTSAIASTQTSTAGATTPDACTKSCTIEGSDIQILYFPATTSTPRDLCALEPTSTVYVSNQTASANLSTTGKSRELTRPVTLSYIGVSGPKLD